MQAEHEGWIHFLRERSWEILCAAVAGIWGAAVGIVKFRDFIREIGQDLKNVRNDIIAQNKVADVRHQETKESIHVLGDQVRRLDSRVAQLGQRVNIEWRD